MKNNLYASQTWTKHELVYCTPSVLWNLSKFYQNLNVSRYYLPSRYVQILTKLRQVFMEQRSMVLVTDSPRIMPTWQMIPQYTYLDLLIFLYILSYFRQCTVEFIHPVLYNC
jgi:hypothetical protein